MRIHPTFHVARVKPVRESPLVPASRPHHPPGSSTLIRFILLNASWRSGAGAVDFNIWWTGRVMVLRRGLGHRPATSWIPTSSVTSTGIILTSLGRQVPALEGGGGYCHVPSCSLSCVFHVINCVMSLLLISPLVSDTSLLPLCVCPTCLRLPRPQLCLICNYPSCPLLVLISPCVFSLCVSLCLCQFVFVPQCQMFQSSTCDS